LNHARRGLFAVVKGMEVVEQGGGLRVCGAGAESGRSAEKTEEYKPQRERGAAMTSLFQV